GPAPALAELGARPVSLVIWTTTPWTLPANLAIAVHPDATYTAVELDGQALIVAQPLVEAFLRLPGVKGRGAPLPLAVPGRALEGLVARHPWIDRDSPVLTADFVAMDAGTGLVHIAPGHGEEDYEVGRRAGLKVYNPVDDAGRFIPEGAHFAGLTVWEANPRIIEHLRAVGALVAGGSLRHTYPRGWRRRSPTPPIRPAGGARPPPCSGPPSSGSSRSIATGCGRRRSTRSGTRCAGFPDGARSASTTWWRTGRSGSSPAGGCGACRSSPSTARTATRCCSTRPWSSTWPRS